MSFTILFILSVLVILLLILLLFWSLDTRNEFGEDATKFSNTISIAMINRDVILGSNEIPKNDKEFWFNAVHKFLLNFKNSKTAFVGASARDIVVPYTHIYIAGHDDHEGILAAALSRKLTAKFQHLTGEDIAVNFQKSSTDFIHEKVIFSGSSVYNPRGDEEPYSLLEIFPTEEALSTLASTPSSPLTPKLSTSQNKEAGFYPGQAAISFGFNQNYCPATVNMSDLSSDERILQALKTTVICFGRTDLISNSSLQVFQFDYETKSYLSRDIECISGDTDLLNGETSWRVFRAYIADDNDSFVKFDFRVRIVQLQGEWDYRCYKSKHKLPDVDNKSKLVISGIIAPRVSLADFQIKRWWACFTQEGLVKFHDSMPTLHHLVESNLQRANIYQYVHKQWQSSTQQASTTQTFKIEDGRKTKIRDVTLDKNISDAMDIDTDDKAAVKNLKLIKRQLQNLYGPELALISYDENEIIGTLEFSDEVSRLNSFLQLTSRPKEPLALGGQEPAYSLGFLDRALIVDIGAHQGIASYWLDQIYINIFPHPEHLKIEVTNTKEKGNPTFEYYINAGQQAPLGPLMVTYIPAST